MPAPNSLAISITFAHGRLKAARQDGCADRICYWRAKVDELLDEWPERTSRGRNKPMSEPDRSQFTLPAEPWVPASCVGKALTDEYGRGVYCARHDALEPGRPLPRVLEALARTGAGARRLHPASNRPAAPQWQQRIEDGIAGSSPALPNIARCPRWWQFWRRHA